MNYKFSYARLGRHDIVVLTLAAIVVVIGRSNDRVAYSSKQAKKKYLIAYINRKRKFKNSSKMNKSSNVMK